MAKQARERLPDRGRPAQHGIVVKFDANKGFGFIRPQDGSGGGPGGPDVFVHIRNVEGRRQLYPGQRVTYYLMVTDKGPAAVKVQAGSRLNTPYLKYALVGFGSALVLIAGLGSALGTRQSLAVWLILWIAAFSIAALGVYGYDKSQAVSGGTRVPELVLYGLALVGGSPGAYLAMRLFHHKTSKSSFQVAFWLIVAVQVAVGAFLLLNR